ncbi:MAG: transcription-repair coupling factor [Acidobacteria bacterium]|nr:transcription-repair coupling factor [Acidobacteriota bacterium]
MRKSPLIKLFQDVARSAEFRRLLAALDVSAPGFKPTASDVPLHATGLVAPARALLAVLMQQQMGLPLLYVTQSNRDAEQTLDIMTAWTKLLGAPAPVFIPTHDIRPYQGLSPHADISEKRAQGLGKLARGEASIVVLPIAALASRVEPPKFYQRLARTIHRREQVDLEELFAHLDSAGYTRHDPVEMPGQFSQRGGILDIFPAEARRPVRMELNGDEVESLREFDVDTQRSVGGRDHVDLPPLTEFPVLKDLLEKLAATLGPSAFDYETYVTGEPFPGWEFLLPLVQPLHHTVGDLCLEAVYFLDEPAELQREMERLWTMLESEHAEAAEAAAAAAAENAEKARPIAAPSSFYITWDDLRGKLKGQPAVRLSGLDPAPPATVFSFASQLAINFHGNLPIFFAELRKLLEGQFRAVILTGSSGETERLAELFTEEKVPFRLLEKTSGESLTDEDIALPVCWLGTGIAAHGFTLPGERIALFGHADIFDTSPAVAPPPPSRSQVSAFLSDLRDLDPGDYVVHAHHGVGCYHGLKEIVSEGVTTEFMELEYKDANKLYVPLTRLDLIQKYHGMGAGLDDKTGEVARPPLDRLGGITWGKTKTRIKKSMEEMAGELLKLYAEREAAEGFAYPPDDHWQREFEESFDFDETPDQARAIKDVSSDMTREHPMDRLVCGDVGYGKTEVAMRAAFRAAHNHKQVAILTPTTVLAFQHYETFRQRFAAFPIRVELLSRFRTAAQQKPVLRDLEAGTVDVVVGTHRLLSKDVIFHDLGLLVVDEEQRFGVRHKERIKAMRSSVDVLSLSATPIPRTLHMALAGLRDMSVIETPPRDRLAIQTVVAPFTDSLIKNAVLQELERGGQVYVVHNRIDSLPALASRIQEMVPEARIGMAHGQMNERHLEKVMYDFVQHKTNVLVATTIVENGLDIPLANTIIINRSDRMGLSELYQLRGRVGRSNRRAYAYLLVPSEKELTPIARKRLSALRQFTDLGSGFRVAALDMELRGAGNLLGGQQHGHVNAIGLEMYTQMLESAVRELRGEKETPKLTTTINLGLDIRIPPAYIPEEHQRLRMYKKLSSLRTAEEKQSIEQELTDRYGAAPEPAKNLLFYATLKLLAEPLRIVSIERKRDTLAIQFQPDSAADPTRLMDYLRKNPAAQFTPTGMLKLRTTARPQDAVGQLEHLLASIQIAGM